MLGLTRPCRLVLALVVTSPACIDSIAVVHQEQLAEADGHGGNPALLPLPEVQHFKEAGRGYKRGSPLFSREAVAKDMGLLPDIQLPEGLKDVPVSNTMKCVIVLVTQFFAIYGALSCVQTLNRAGHKLEDEERSLTHASHSLFFIPMLCILFLGVRMRAVQLAKGHAPEQFGLPPWWLKCAEIVCVACCFALSIIAFTGSMLHGDEWEGAAGRTRIALNRCGQVLLIMWKVVTLSLYICFAIICCAAWALEPPSELWQPGESPKVSSALTCTIFLASIYFAVYLGLATAKLINDSGILAQPVRFSHSQRTFRNAASTLSLVPMTCCLFLSVRLRALQMDPVSGNPQEWVQACFYACSASIALQTLLSLVSAALGSSKDKDAATAPTFEDAKDVTAGVSESLRLLLMAGLYAWLIAIIVGAWIMVPDVASSTAPETPPMPSCLKCIFALSALFFAVYLLLWVGFKFDFEGSDGVEARAVQAVREAVGFCPMISIVFMGAMVRALQISHGFGAPQDWCQVACKVATTAAVLMTAVRVGSRIPSIPKGPCTVLQYLCLFAIYASVATVICALAIMTPETTA